MSALRIVFAGTPEFSVAPLEALIQSGHEVIAVYTQPDRPAGRGRKLTHSPVKQVALDHAIPVFQPVNFKATEALDQLVALQADLMVVVAYGLILPQLVLDAPRLGCINIHASLLPRWRGAAPIQRSIQAGDAQTGITIMQMDAGLDTGPMWLCRNINIDMNMTGGELHDQLSALGASALLESLPLIIDNKSEPTPQPETGVTYAHKLSKDEARIDWNESADDIHQLICAFNPWPVAFSTLGADKLRIWESRISTLQSELEPGTVFEEDNAGIHVSCASGAVCVTRLQLPGKRVIRAAEFLNARTAKGMVLH